MIVCLSASHKSTTLPMLEALNIPDSDKFAPELLKGKVVQECVLLQTCHRVEIFQVSSDQTNGEAVKQTMKLWSTKTGVSLDIINKTVQTITGKEALGHLFSLAAGLESVILGEDQILGQIRSAWQIAKTGGTTGLILDRAFMKALNTGRKIRTETKINEGSVSISSAAVDLAARELGDLAFRKALIIGAGEAGELAAENLKSKVASAILIANRTYEKSRLLAQKISGEAIPFENIYSAIPNVDLVIAAVSVTQPLLREEHFASFANDLSNPKRLLLIDISQPRAIQEEVGSLQGIQLKTIDDLKNIVTQNMHMRETESEKCRTIISQELNRFEAELSKLVAQPLITEICRKLEEIRKKELERAIRKMGETDQKKLSVMDRFSRELTERIAQIPVEQLRAAALNNNNHVLSVAEQLFLTKPGQNQPAKPTV